MGCLLFGPCFSMQYLVSFLVVQLSSWGRKSWLLHFDCLDLDLSISNHISCLIIMNAFSPFPFFPNIYCIPCCFSVTSYLCLVFIPRCLRSTSHSNLTIMDSYSCVLLRKKTTITHCRPTHHTVRKSHITLTVTKHPKDIWFQNAKDAKYWITKQGPNKEPHKKLEEQ